MPRIRGTSLVSSPHRILGWASIIERIKVVPWKNFIQKSTVSILHLIFIKVYEGFHFPKYYCWNKSKLTGSRHATDKENGNVSIITLTIVRLWLFLPDNFVSWLGLEIGKIFGFCRPRLINWLDKLSLICLRQKAIFLRFFNFQRSFFLVYLGYVMRENDGNEPEHDLGEELTGIAT